MTTTEPSQPLTGFELDNIEGRWQRYVALRDEDSMETSVHDVPDLIVEVDRLRAKVQQILGEQYDLLSDRDRLRDALAASETRCKDLARRLDQHRDDLVNVNAEIARIVSENNAQADKLGKAERLAEGWMRAGNRSISSSALAAEHFDALNECGRSLARVLAQSGEGQANG